MSSVIVRLQLYFLLLLSLSSCSEKAKRRILVIHSYENSNAAYPDYNRMIAEQFQQKRVDADIRTVYLDCEPYMANEELERMSFLLDSTSRGWKPEVILVNEDQAAYSLLKCGFPLVKEVPIVFAGVNYPNWKLIEQYPNVTGLHDKIDFLKIVEVSKELLAKDIRLFTAIDSTYLDRQIRRDGVEQFKDSKVIGFGDDFGVPVLRQFRVPVEEGYTSFSIIHIRIGTSKEEDLLWALSKNYRNQCYIQLKRDFTTVNFGNICSSPCLTAINEGFGYGEKLLGGYFTTLPDQVEEEVKVATRILKGERPVDIPVAESRKRYMVDWKVMQQQGISKDRIPDHYTILHIPFSKKYPVLWLATIITSVGTLVTLFVCLLALYLREQKKKKQALYALANEKETLALAIEGGTTYVWKFENEYFVFENAFWQSLGMPLKELPLGVLMNYVHPEHWNELKLCWTKLDIAQKAITRLRCNFDGKGYQWWEFRYTTKQLESGGIKTVGLLLNIQDIKDREEELEAARMLAEKAELKQSFLANMSHEIRTPLNSIVGFSNILAVDEELEPEERQEYIDTINKNSELLLKLINDILELSRMESGYMSFSYEKCLVDDLINDVYATYQVLIPSHLEFLKETENLGLEINVDKDRLTQVLTNFLNNASKFTEIGLIKLGYYYLPAEEQVCIFVEDTGRGIPREEQRMIFSRFYKQNEFSQGAGLGLSICQVIIEKLGGKIGLRSELGKGSCFTVILPCRKLS